MTSSLGICASNFALDQAGSLFVGNVADLLLYSSNPQLPSQSTNMEALKVLSQTVVSAGVHVTWGKDTSSPFKDRKP